MAQLFIQLMELELAIAGRGNQQSRGVGLQRGVKPHVPFHEAFGQVVGLRDSKVDLCDDLVVELLENCLCFFECQRPRGGL